MSNSAQKRPAARPTKLNLARFERGAGRLEMHGDRLVVRISRDSHPELYEIDQLIRRMRHTIQTYGRRPGMRDLVEFLSEQERGLQIILRNHLEQAMRKYLGQAPV